MEDPPSYLAYLLRLWQASDDETAPPQVEPPRCCKTAAWRASLESSRTGERKGFASLDDLFAYLRRETGTMIDIDSDDGTRDAPRA